MIIANPYAMNAMKWYSDRPTLCHCLHQTHSADLDEKTVLLACVGRRRYNGASVCLSVRCQTATRKSRIISAVASCLLCWRLTALQVITTGDHYRWYVFSCSLFSRVASVHQLQRSHACVTGGENSPAASCGQDVFHVIVSRCRTVIIYWCTSYRLCVSPAITCLLHALVSCYHEQLRKTRLYSMLICA